MLLVCWDTVVALIIRIQWLFTVGGLEYTQTNTSSTEPTQSRVLHLFGLDTRLLLNVVANANERIQECAFMEWLQLHSYESPHTHFFTRHVLLRHLKQLGDRGHAQRLQIRIVLLHRVVEEPHVH